MLLYVRYFIKGIIFMLFVFFYFLSIEGCCLSKVKTLLYILIYCFTSASLSLVHMLCRRSAVGGRRSAVGVRSISHVIPWQVRHSILVCRIQPVSPSLGRNIYYCSHFGIRYFYCAYT